MRAVLYTHDMEPITVLHLDAFQEKFLRQNGSVNVEVLEPVNYRAPLDATTKVHFKIVRITNERLIRRGREHMMLFTQNEEDAMLLRSVFLPGQQREVMMAEQEAFGRGILAAMRFR